MTTFPRAAVAAGSGPRYIRFTTVASGVTNTGTGVNPLILAFCITAVGSSVFVSYTETTTCAVPLFVILRADPLAAHIVARRRLGPPVLRSGL